MSHQQPNSLTSMLFICMAVPLWTILCMKLPESPGLGRLPVGFLLPPIVLVGIAFALHRLFLGSRDAVAKSVFLAPVIVLAVLSAANRLAS